MATPINFTRALAAAIVGGIALLLSTLLLWGILAAPLINDPNEQSPKLLAVWQSIRPLPVIITAPHLMLLGFVLFAFIHTLIYAQFSPLLPSSGWKKGAYYGIILWLSSYAFFEFFAPFNLFSEPLHLVSLELILWLIVGVVEGVLIASIYKD